jgi:hypothetical protein
VLPQIGHDLFRQPARHENVLLHLERLSTGGSGACQVILYHDTAKKKLFPDLLTCTKSGNKKAPLIAGPSATNA